jgi:hypothetical protein
MSLIVKAPVVIKVQGWDSYDVRARDAARTGIFNVASVVNRFHARYKLARSFREMQLEGYSEQTVAGYSALMRASLHWTAFEMFKKALNIKDTRGIFKSYPFDSHLEAIRACFTSKEFFQVVRGHLTDEKQRKQLDAFAAGDQISPLVLAKALRHIFFHGALTPNAGGASPAEVIVICDELCKYMVEIMDCEFFRHSEILIKKIG